MKKLLLIPFLMLGICRLEAQIVITGVMYDPQGADAPAAGASSGGKYGSEPDYIHKGGYEYIQFMATEDIDFAVKNYSVVVNKNGGSTTEPLTKGWAAGKDRTFKFDLTSGTAAKGTYFYVGGPEKVIGGFLVLTVDGEKVYTPTLDMSSSNWIRTIPYSDASAVATTPPAPPAVPDMVGDGFGDASGALMNNSGNPTGIAVFDGTAVTEASVPIDAIFYTGTNPITQAYTDAIYTPANEVTSTPAMGYRIPNNDHYKQEEGGVAQPFFGMGTNKFGFIMQNYAPFKALSTNKANFLKLGGKYNATTGVWDEPRTASYVTLVPTADAAGVAFGTLAMIESGGASVLPVSLVSFIARTQNNGVVLSWVTASEQNNKQFTVFRSTDGKRFDAIGSVFGNGTTQNASTYSFTDVNPVAGVNYYKLVQEDFNGKAQESTVISATTDLEKTSVSVYGNAQGANLNVFAVSGGRATIILTDTNGRTLTSVNTQIAKGYNNLPIAISLGAGVYVASVQIGTDVVQAKFIVQ